MTGRSDWRQILRSLEDPLRRRLLVALLGRDRQGDEIAIPDDLDLGRRDPETARIELAHVHLPLLEARGYVMWDRDADLVTPGPEFDEVRPLLELLEADRDALPDGWR